MIVLPARPEPIPPPAHRHRAGGLPERTGRTARLLAVLVGILLQGALLEARPAGAQPFRRVSVGTGVVINQARDRLASPVTFRSAGAPISLMYAHRTERVLHDVALSFMGSGFIGKALSPGTHPSGAAAEYLLLTGGYTYSWRVASALSTPNRLYLGGSWHTLAYIREYLYQPNAGEYTWDVLSSLDLHATGLRRLGPGILDLSVDVPLIAYVNRPPYAVAGDPIFRALFHYPRFLGLGSFVLFPRLLGITTDWAYELPLAERLGVSIGYRLTFYRYDRPAPTAALLHAANLRLAFAL